MATNHYLIGLFGEASERARNVALLKSMSWIEIPMVYTDGQFGVLAFEKGPAGEKAFADAFDAWASGG